MSVSPKDGVLDAFCRTHDIPNLYVFGGNAFPSTGDKHPTLTMMALTASGCDQLVESGETGMIRSVRVSLVRGSGSGSGVQRVRVDLPRRCGAEPRT